MLAAVLVYGQETPVNGKVIERISASDATKRDLSPLS